MAKKRYELLIFDWDGTLVDSLGYIVECVIKAAGDLNLPLPEPARVRHCIGLSSTHSLQALFPGETDTVLQKVRARYQAHFFDHNIDKVRLFPGVRETLQHLNDQEYLLAVATAKGRRGLDSELSSTELTTLFHATRTVDESNPKPHPQMILDLLETLSIAPDAALMIGDTAYDLQMAKNAHIDGIGVTYGGHSVELLKAESPIALVDKIEDLRNWC